MHASNIKGCVINIQKKVIIVNMGEIGINEETKTFTVLTESIESMRDWLKENKITHIAMKSIGVYWKSIFNILEPEFEIILVNPSHVINVSRRKTDKLYSKWITKLWLSGLVIKQRVYDIFGTIKKI